MIDRVVLLNDASTARGGATGLALASMRALRQNGVPVTFIAGDAGDNFEMRDLGVNVVPLGQALLLDAGPRSAALRGLYNRLTVETVGRWIASNDTPRTLYHIHTWSKILSPSVFRAMRPVKDRLVISAHDFFLVCPNGGYVIFRNGAPCSLRPLGAACMLTDCDRRSYAHKFWRLARQHVQTRLLDFRGRAPLVLAVHEGMRPGLERGGVPTDVIRVLRNPVRPFRNVRVRAERNKEFLFIGRLDREKGPDLAAQAAKVAGVPLRMIGAGPMSPMLRELHPEITLEGWRTHEEIGALIASARALVVSSRFPEPFGLAACEALGSGLPVIINKTALLAGEISESGAGVACDVHNGDEIASLLHKIARDDDSVERMSKCAFKSAQKLGNSFGDWFSKLVLIYEELISEIHRR